jgi:hypothetical protein
MNGRFEELSGFDRVIRQLRRFEGTNSGVLTLVLPPGQIAPDLEPRITLALAGFCDARIVDLEESKLAVRLLGKRGLRFGLIFLAVCLLIAGIIDSIDRTRGYLGGFLVEVAIILGWIALWYPFDLLIYARWPVERDRRILKQIRGMRVRIEPEQESRPVEPEQESRPGTAV